MCYTNKTSAFAPTSTTQATGGGLFANNAQTNTLGQRPQTTTVGGLFGQTQNTGTIGGQQPQTGNTLFQNQRGLLGAQQSTQPQTTGLFANQGTQSQLQQQGLQSAFTGNQGLFNQQISGPQSFRGGINTQASLMNVNQLQPMMTNQQASLTSKTDEQELRVILEYYNSALNNPEFQQLTEMQNAYQAKINLVKSLKEQIMQMRNVFDQKNVPEGQQSDQENRNPMSMVKELENKIVSLKQNNYILLGKILKVHSIIQNIAYKQNVVERKNNDELKVQHLLNEVDSSIHDTKQKLTEVQMKAGDQRKIEQQKEDPQKRESKKNEASLQESRRNMILMLDKMKKGLEILKIQSEKDKEDLHLLEKYLE